MDSKFKSHLGKKEKRIKKKTIIKAVIIKKNYNKKGNEKPMMTNHCQCLEETEVQLLTIQKNKNRKINS